MKYTKKIYDIGSFDSRIYFRISYMLTRSNEQKESITGTLTLSSDDKIEPINIGDNVDLNYNYITNPNKLDQRNISADGLIVFGDKVNEYMNKMGYKRTELTITNIKKKKVPF